MESIEALRRNFAGVCRQGMATPLARFLAWRCAQAMPHPASPGFDERALGAAFDELASLVGRPGADSSMVWAWSARAKGLGALPGWRPGGEASGWGLDPEGDAPTGPLDGFGLFESGLGPWPWRDVSGEAMERLGASKVWIGALRPPRRAGGDLEAALSCARLIRSRGLDPAQGLSGSCLALAVPQEAWQWAAGRPGWALSGGPDPVSAVARAWAAGLDARWGAKLREPSGMASSAPRSLRPNPISAAARRAMLAPPGRLPAHWRSSPEAAWAWSLGLAISGGEPSWGDLLGGRAKTMAWTARKSLEAAGSLPVLG